MNKFLNVFYSISIRIQIFNFINIVILYILQKKRAELTRDGRGLIETVALRDENARTKQNTASAWSWFSMG